MSGFGIFQDGVCMKELDDVEKIEREIQILTSLVEHDNKEEYVYWESEEEADVIRSYN